MTSRLAPPLDEQLAELEAENRKLRKINKVLMDRVERDMDTQGGNAFTLFQTAVTLESKVSERTAELTSLTRQLRAGVWVAEPAAVPVGPLLARLAREYTPQAAAAGLQVRVVPTGAVAHTDRGLLERVVRNFLSNAIRYTERGRILIGLIGCRCCAGSVRVEVWDTGIGIPGDKLAHTFEEFRQLGNNPRRGDKGVGLGLAIVDRIARLLDVRVTVTSRVGHGSCFAITLPLGSLPEAAEIPSAAPMLEAGFAGRFVAVVDNDAQVLQAMAALLGTWGCRLAASASTEALLAALDGAAGPPDLVIADHYLDDGRYGIEAIAALRARFGPVPALIMSSDRSPARKAEAQALGCGFLAKPASPAKLRAMLSFLLSRPAGGAAKRS